MVLVSDDLDSFEEVIRNLARYSLECPSLRTTIIVDVLPTCRRVMDLGEEDDRGEASIS